MLIYNSENECYSRFIPIDQAAEIQEKIKKLETRLQNMPVNPIDQTECTDKLDIDDVNSIKELLKSENFNINMPINRRRASLFLVACYFCSDKDGSCLFFLLWRLCLFLNILFHINHCYNSE